MSLLRAAAEWYAGKGLHVFPLAPRSKEPAIPGSRGFLDAEPNAWPWDFLGSSNIGVSAIGSGVIIVDVDDPDAVEDLPGSLPHTWTVLTARGSQHHYRMPDGMAPIWMGIPGRVDIRWRGYGILPPSIHPTGRIYTWEASSRIDDTPLARAPSWLVGLSRPTKPIIPDGSATDSFLGVAFASLGWVGREVGGGRLCVRCPWAEGHSDRRGYGGDSSCVILPPGKGAPRFGAWSCRHGSCSGRKTEDAIAWLPKEALVAAALNGYRRELAILGSRS